ncbi:VIT1/CCC1 transporter family protein [Sciscionella sediminilitoris]|uniref:VIT1/CCC1 transporter family protein n=1 Tax=Sciscionella sediminilitoris TaxID=1445613 RepID=UPI0004DF3554|nr:VIT family protein [Sciscionella sp. SE31]
MTQEKTTHAGEPHEAGTSDRLNWLRAGVLGANDGIVSTASIVVGVAGASATPAAVLTAGAAGLFAGAMSMASGEYVSVSSQRDAEQAMLAQERAELAEDPEAELTELAGIYEAKGLSPELARQVAEQLSAHDALGAHAAAELGIDPDHLASPWQAALSSFLAFSAGAILPLLSGVLLTDPYRVPVTGLVVILALIITGTTSSRLGHAPRLRATVRNVLGGLLAMAVTYGIGTLVGHAL